MSDLTCVAPDCERGWFVKSRKLCTVHYQRFMKTGSFDLPVRAVRDSERQCTKDGCPKPLKASGMCAMHWNRRKRRSGSPTMCAWCWEVFTPRRGNQLCCSDVCANQKRAEYARGYQTVLRVEHPKPKVTRVPTPCEYCGVVFGATKRRSRYCSDECRAVDKNRANWKHLNARRARLRDAFVESFDRREIFERDGWICQLCTAPIDRELRWPHPMSASLDHIIPIARDGEHSRANSQASHLTCNVRKGARVA